jgi:hypothetical protein
MRRASLSFCCHDYQLFAVPIMPMMPAVMVTPVIAIVAVLRVRGARLQTKSCSAK